jgi:hypothetical protein
MGCTSETDWTSDLKEIQDPKVKAARDQLLGIAMTNATKSATPLPENAKLFAGTNSLLKNSKNIVNNMSTGKNFTSSKPITYGSVVTESMPGIEWASGDGDGDDTDPTPYVCGWPQKDSDAPCPASFATESELEAHRNGPAHDDNKDSGSMSGAKFDPYATSNWMPR